MHGAPKLERGMAHDGKTQRETADAPRPRRCTGARNLRRPPKLPLSARPSGDIAGCPGAPSLGAHKPGDRSANASARAPRATPAKRRGRASAAPATRRADGAHQAAAGGSGARPGRRQRRCPLDRRPDLRAAAEAVQPAVPAGGGRFRRLARHRRPAGLGHAGLRAVPPADRSHQPDAWWRRPPSLLPIALFWFLALLAWRAQELKLMSSAMTEVAVRLAEPDRAAEQSAASLGQAVRRQVSFMNEAISRALGRAGELEALVHNEVAALEQVLRRERAQDQRPDPGAGRRAPRPGEHHRQGRRDPEVDGQRGAHADREALPAADQARQDHRGRRAEPDRAREPAHHRQRQPRDRARQPHPAAAGGARRLHGGPRRHAGHRAEALDMQLVERTRALDAAFSERLALFDNSMLRSAAAIDNAVSEKARALTVAMENHVRALSDTLGRQAGNIDESMMPRHRGGAPHQRQHHAPVAQGHRGPFQPGRPAEERVGEPGAPDIRRHQPLRQPGPVDRQRRQRAGTANSRIDSTLQKRHAELNETLHRCPARPSSSTRS